MFRFKSIIWRIIFLHVIALSITSVFMLGALYWLLKAETNDLHQSAMREQAETVAHHLLPQSDGTWILNLPPALQDLYSEAYGRYTYAVIDAAGRVLFSSLNNRDPIFREDTRAAEVRFFETRKDHTTIAGASAPREIAGQKIWVQVAENMTHRDVLIDDIVADFFKRVGWITLPILLVLLIIDIVIFRRALRPLLQASEQAQSISPARTEVRLPTDDIPNEILPLVQAINQALDRLEQGFRIQREFTADAAHELRTPLAILRSRIDTMSDQKLMKSLHQDFESMGRIISQLLDVAELESFSVDPREKADLQSVCTEVAEFVAPLAIDQGKTVALSGAPGPVWVRGNSEALGRAIRNLAENAINHTPSGTSAEIVVESDGTVRVLDQGPGVAAEERKLIFRRFWRRDRRRSGSAGLGLSIVERIVEAHAGNITVENRASGGAQFSLNFSRVEPALDTSRAL